MVRCCARAFAVASPRREAVEDRDREAELHRVARPPEEVRLREPVVAGREAELGEVGGPRGGHRRASPPRCSPSPAARFGRAREHLVDERRPLRGHRGDRRAPPPASVAPGPAARRACRARAPRRGGRSRPRAARSSRCSPRGSRGADPTSSPRPPSPSDPPRRARPGRARAAPRRPAPGPRPGAPRSTRAWCRAPPPAAGTVSPAREERCCAIARSRWASRRKPVKTSQLTCPPALRNREAPLAVTPVPGSNRSLLEMPADALALSVGKNAPSARVFAASAPATVPSASTTAEAFAIPAATAWSRSISAGAASSARPAEAPSATRTATVRARPRPCACNLRRGEPRDPIAWPSVECTLPRVAAAIPARPRLSQRSR